MANASIVSKMAVGGHPIHPMLIHFPVAALLGLVGTDVAYLVTDDFFWARASLWLAGVGMVGGWISGAIGLLDLLIVKQIRRLITGWCHGLLSIMALSLATLNWLIRVADADLHILPWGIYLSLLGGLVVSLAGFLGGQLVFEHAVGVKPGKTERRARRLERQRQESRS